MTERTFEDIELDLKLFQIKLDNAENSKRLLQKLKNDVMELQIELLESLKLGDAYLTESEELEENNDFILTVNSETLSLEESYDNRINFFVKSKIANPEYHTNNMNLKILILTLICIP